MKQASGDESRFINLWLVPLEAGFGFAENDLIKHAVIIMEVKYE